MQITVNDAAWRVKMLGMGQQAVSFGDGLKMVRLTPH